MDKLISMTDFVINEYKNSMWDSFNRVYRYAEFLKQPLKLEMFIGENRVFEGFEIFNEYCVKHSTVEGIYIDEEYCMDHIVEDLINSSWITPTPSALKAIGIE